jgi:hypothetical protein
MKNLQALSFPALIPKEGFRWICHGDDDRWRAADPPADWSAADYLAALHGEDVAKPELSDRFYLAASLDEIVTTGAHDKTTFGHLVTEPDLYLQFASAKGTPPELKVLANKFGLLDGTLNLKQLHDILRVERSKSVDLEEAFRFDPRSDVLAFCAQRADEWLGIFCLVRSMINDWTQSRKARDFVCMSSYLEQEYNSSLSGSLTYQLELNEQTGEAQSRIICSSLRNYIDVQWGMSVAANVLHRQCVECPNWFSVHPDTSRPEKVFCSDACRMRAYRKRKGGKRRGKSKSKQ